MGPETPTSQTGFCFYELSMHKKANIILNVAKNNVFLYYFDLLLWNSCEIRSLYNTFVEFCKHRVVMKPLQIYHYVAVPIGLHPVVHFHGWKIFVKI